MTIEELYQLVDHEIDWLYYYALQEDRNILNESSDVYKDLKSIGYTKRQLPLKLRCSPCSILSSKSIEIGIEIDLLEKSDSRDGLTPLEVIIKIFPERKMEFLNRLKTIETSDTSGWNKKFVKINK